MIRVRDICPFCLPLGAIPDKLMEVSGLRCGYYCPISTSPRPGGKLTGPRETAETQLNKLKEETLGKWCGNCWKLWKNMETVGKRSKQRRLMAWQLDPRPVRAASAIFTGQSCETSGRMPMNALPISESWQIMACSSC